MIDARAFSPGPLEDVRLAHDAVARYGWPEDTEVGLLARSENTAWLIEHASHGKAVLRIHRLGYHSRQEIESELAWMSALRKEAGIRTPGVRSALDGRAVLELAAGDEAANPCAEQRFCVLFEHLAGREPLDHEVDIFVRLGEITAVMHRHARGWRPPRWFRRFHWDYDAAFGAEARWGRWQDGAGVGAGESAVLAALESTLRRRLAAFGTGAERYGLVHADTRLANLLVDDDPNGTLGILDFDDCGYSWYLYDLATALSFFEHEPHVPDLIDAWLSGYRRRAELPAVEEAEIWTFVLFRRLLLVAWMASHPTVDVAKRLGAAYTAGTCDLAESYMSRFA